jgi:protein-disulfide isomerase
MCRPSVTVKRDQIPNLVFNASIVWTMQGVSSGKDFARMQRPLPFVIILVVLVLAAGGAFWLYQFSQSASQPESTSIAGGSSPSPQPPAPAAEAPVERRSVVTLEEFGDYQCPPCGALHPDLAKLKQEFGDRLRIVYRHFPISQIHPNARPAAHAAVAASFQGSFWEMHNLLYENQAAWSSLPDIKPQLTQYARQAGLDVKRFLNDLESPRTTEIVTADQLEGAQRNVVGTPTIILNGEMIPFDNYALDKLREEIDRRLLPRE